ncbi:MAG: type III secretion system export apparatus subunit SctV [Pseudomonadota bacterium]
MRWLGKVDFRAGLSRYSDLLLAGMVVGIVAMMIVPMPTVALDILITTNISIAVILLLISIYVSDALRIASLPSILLITTLFRLSLNVSSTRLILLQADAGSVIRSFGTFVVAGNLVVGAVIFLILTLIQFIVIAKGSERVAEVAARFTLDAMPGKQMAIDADVRAGVIDNEEARRQRALLQRESQLYGSMDGAMKFVKGDAIAGILITLINIFGGLLIGVFQREMTMADAARVYSVLTIGDGLVSQIPALLISVAAGIVVTRVASEDEGAHLGWDIGQQVLGQPKAIVIAAGLLALLGMVPGLPTLPFFVLAAFCGLVGFGLIFRIKEKGGNAVVHTDELPQIEEFAAPSSIALEVSQELSVFVDDSQRDGRFIRALIPGLREMLNTELGVVFPGVHVRAGNTALGSDEYQILLGEIPMVGGKIPPQTVIALATSDELQREGVQEMQSVEVPGVVSPAFRVPTAVGPMLLEKGIQVVEPPTELVLHLGQILRAQAFEFMGIQETQQLLDNLEQTYPVLVHETVPKIVPIKIVAEVLRRLLEEGISIRNLRDILESLAEWGSTEKDPVILTEHVRVALRRYMSYRFGGPEATIRAYLLDPMIEETVRDSIRKTSKGSYLAIEPELKGDIVEAVGNQLKTWPSDESLPVIMTNMEIRRYVKRLIEVDFPQLAVLSFNELLPQVTISPVGKIEVAQ